MSVENASWSVLWRPTKSRWRWLAWAADALVLPGTAYWSLSIALSVWSRSFPPDPVPVAVARGEIGSIAIYFLILFPPLGFLLLCLALVPLRLWAPAWFRWAWVRVVLLLVVAGLGLWDTAVVTEELHWRSMDPNR